MAKRFKSSPLREMAAAVRVLVLVVASCAGATRETAATRALEASAEEFARAMRGGRFSGGPTGVRAEPLMRAAEALMPAFDSYGKFFGSAARKDLLGNVRKLEALGANASCGDVGLLPLADADITHPDSASRALFWMNRIFQQIAETLDHLVRDRSIELVPVAIAAYEKVTARYNSWAHRKIAKILLYIIPNRAAIVKMYGQDSFDDLAPVFETWVARSKAAREAIDAYFEARPHLLPPLRFGGEGACRTGTGALCGSAEAQGSDGADETPRVRGLAGLWRRVLRWLASRLSRRPRRAAIGQIPT